MDKVGFIPKWIKWIKDYLKSSKILVLFNRTPTQEFNPCKGLRQGDPLTPFLFLTMVEGLAGLVEQTAKKKIGKGPR